MGGDIYEALASLKADALMIREMNWEAVDGRVSMEELKIEETPYCLCRTNVTPFNIVFDFVNTIYIEDTWRGDGWWC